jgi:hypothetical protein
LRLVICYWLLVGDAEAFREINEPRVGSELVGSCFF